MPPREDPFGWVGHVLDDKYRVDTVVGEGGFGVVYRAHHLGFEQAVALKCLKVNKNLDPAAHDAFLKKFLAEGKLLHRLSRATAEVVQALDVGVATSPNGSETPYLVLEWLDGTTLDKELRSRRGTTMPLEEAVALLEPAARGLAVAHDQGVSHRDVKPANMMLTDVGGRLTLKVVDFGIAKAPSDEPTANASPHDGLGSGMSAFTPRYGAPEQFSRKFGTTGTWTDVYALALILVELVTGAPALEGEDPVQLYVATSDLQHRPTLRARGADVGDAVEATVARALEVDPQRRFATAGEFWDALHAAIDRPKIQSVRPPAISLSSNDPSVPRAAGVPSIGDGSGMSTSAPHASSSQPMAQRSGPTGTITVMLRDQRRRRAVWIGALLVTSVVVVAAFVGMREAERQTSNAGSASAPSQGGPPAPGSVSPTGSGIPPKVDNGEAPAAAPKNMALIPAGRFLMGSDAASRSEKPQHPVRITREFYIDLTEVTTDAYGDCVHDKACSVPRFHPPGRGHGIATSTTCNAIGDPNFARQPVNCVSYEQAATYCKHEGKRLPTEAEWEYAARGTDGRTYPWGEQEPHSCRFAIVGGAEGTCGARKGTYEVATTVDGKSPFGLFDMAGNVWEWVADDWASYQKDEAVDPILPPRTSKGVIRGGSWDYSAAAAKAYTRMALERPLALNNVGFRCAKDAAAAPADP